MPIKRRRTAVALPVASSLPHPPRTKSDFTPSLQQSAIFDWVTEGSGNAFVEAVAGSGKTKTLTEACMLMYGDIAFAAFNKKIADEIAAKMSGVPNVDVATFHSFGFAAWRKYVASQKGRHRVVVDARKKNDQMMDAVEVPWELRKAVRLLVSIAKQSGVEVTWDSLKEIGYNGDPEEPMEVPAPEWDNLIDHFDILLEVDGVNGNEAAITQRLIEFAIRGVAWAATIGQTIIDFDDMIWLPLVFNAPIRQFDWVLVDESQDTNDIRRQFASRMLKKGGRFLAVGDRWQCQPEGTMVSVLRSGGNRWHEKMVEQVPIEDVRPNEVVVGYYPADSATYRRRVERVAKRAYAGLLIEITTNRGLCSSYTPEHRCFATFSALRGKHGVYLMRKDDQYRIGKCKMDYVQSSGLSTRMRSEKADCAWLLDVYDTEEEAFFFEQAISGKYGIPQLMFEALKMTRSTYARRAGLLQKAWQYIGDNSLRGAACLQDFGRDPNYPLMDRYSNKQQSTKRPRQIAACNLITGCEVLVPGNKGHLGRGDWQTVVVNRIHYVGTVHSLQVEGGYYVADGIVTHNSIYGFTGADSDASERIIDDFECVSLPLTTTYRCCKAATRVAQRYVPHIEAHENNIEGHVVEIYEDDFYDLCLSGKSITITPSFCITPPAAGDAILCRNTKPLVALAMKMIRQGIGCHVEGRDIGAKILGLLRKWKSVTTVTELVARLTGYKSLETEKLIAQDALYRIEALHDRVDTAIMLTDGCATLAEIDDKIRRMFEDVDESGARRTITLSTIHKAKGREWKRIFIAGFDRYLPSKYARQEWSRQSERNIAYVGVTRAKEELILVMMDQ